MDFTQWNWIERYRVWQANRKTFLYPDNWLEPEQREEEPPEEQAQAERRARESSEPPPQ